MKRCKQSASNEDGPTVVGNVRVSEVRVQPWRRLLLRRLGAASPVRCPRVSRRMLLYTALAACVLLTGCRSVQFEGASAGYFPPDGPYSSRRAQVNLYVETADSGSMYGRQDKRIWIRVEDPAGKRRLGDRVDHRSCSIPGNSTWRVVAPLHVDLFET